jgi:hypothetical protein
LAETVYHVEMRQFPHNMCRFNLSAQELRAAVLGPWVRDRMVEFGERKWNPEQAKLTVLEGPRIPVGQLSMGRGWRTAERQGRDVTDQLLAALRREPASASTEAASAIRAAGAVGRPAGSTLGERVGDSAADSLGLELLSRIGAEPAPLRLAWELAVERHPGAPASATLALTERALESLLRARLIVLLHAGDTAADVPADVPAGEPGADPRPVGEDQLGEVLAEVASWDRAGVPGALWMQRT